MYLPLSFTPAGRLAQSSVLVESKLYFFGGSFNSGCSNEVFYLDVSRPFNMVAPQWNDLTQNSGIPFKNCWGTASSSDKQTIYLFGGITEDIVTNKYTPVSVLYSFNLNSLTWNVPNTKGTIPEKRRETKSAIDNTGKMYIFAGSADELTGSPTSIYFNDMVIFNTVDLSWSINTTPVIGRDSYTATLLPNGVIVYIGGYDSTSNDIDISQIALYDTKSLTWSNKVAKLINPIESRDTHTAVLAPGGKIIIYGGTKIITGNSYAQVTPDIAVLNTETEPFEWTVPPVSSNVGIVPSLAAHTANLVDNYMIVAFGNITQPNGYPLENKSSKIYLMDIRNYTWVDTFEPSTPSNPSAPSNNTPSNPSTTSILSNPSVQTPNKDALESNNQLTTMKVVIAAMSGIFGTIFLIVIGFFGYRWHQKRQIGKKNEIMRIHGNHGNAA